MRYNFTCCLCCRQHLNVGRKDGVTTVDPNLLPRSDVGNQLQWLSRDTCFRHSEPEEFWGGARIPFFISFVCSICSYEQILFNFCAFPFCLVYCTHCVSSLTLDSCKMQVFQLSQLVRVEKYKLCNIGQSALASLIFFNVVGSHFFSLNLQLAHLFLKLFQMY